MHLRVLFTLLSLLAFTAPLVQAQSPGELKQRMEKRIPAIEALKGRGSLGENNRGLLEARGALGAEDQGLLATENSDREAVYAFIAKQTGSTPADVAKARARQIAERSPAGVWLQRESGEWYKK